MEEGAAYPELTLVARKSWPLVDYEGLQTSLFLARRFCPRDILDTTQFFSGYGSSLMMGTLLLNEIIFNIVNTLCTTHTAE